MDNNFLNTDLDLFEALGITEEWEDQQLADEYTEQDARTLKEYGFWSRTNSASISTTTSSN